MHAQERGVAMAALATPMVPALHLYGSSGSIGSTSVSCDCFKSQTWIHDVMHVSVHTYNVTVSNDEMSNWSLQYVLLVLHNGESWYVYGTI